MLLKMLDRLEETLVAVLIAAATLLIFVAVVHRYGTSGAISLAQWGKAHGQLWLFDAGRTAFDWLRQVNLTFAQELCIYMFIWMAKFGAAYGVRTGIHVGVDVAVQRLSPAARRPVVLGALLAGALFTGIVGALGARFVWNIGHTDQVSADMEVPMWLVYLAIPLGSWLMCFRFLQVAVGFVRTGAVPVHDHGHVEGLEDAAGAA